MSDIWPTITSDTSMEELQAIHKRIWDYVIEHGEKPDTPYVSNCVACEYSHIMLDGPYDCSMCPIQWPDGKHCGDYGSLYDTFSIYLMIGIGSIWKDLAKQIRDVEFKTREEPLC